MIKLEHKGIWFCLVMYLYDYIQIEPFRYQGKAAADYYLYCSATVLAPPWGDEILRLSSR